MVDHNDHDGRQSPRPTSTDHILPGGGLRELNLYNFKSWAGHHTIGPFRTFSCIIGCNGSGKSNVMDAISFVLGVRTSQLRGSQLKDLIHRQDGSKEPSGSAHVEIVYESASFEITIFRRTITGSKSSYSINGRSMRWSEYESELQKFGVLVKAQNFLVFQGDVESIAQKSPSELTDLFEQISGSSSLVQPYAELQEAAAEAESEFLRSFEKKKTLSKEKRQLKDQKEEAERYQEMQQSYQEMKQQLFLFELFHMDNDLSNNDKQIADLKSELHKISNEMASLEDNLAEAGKNIGKNRRLRSAAERDLNTVSKKTASLKTSSVKLNEELTYLNDNLRSAEAEYEKAQNDSAEQKQVIKSIETELENLIAERDRITSHSSKGSEGGTRISPEHLELLKRCKQEAATKSSESRHRQSTLEHRIRSLTTSLFDLETQLDGLQQHRQQLLTSETTHRDRLKKLDRHLEESREKFDLLQTQLQELGEEKEETEKQRSSLNSQLNTIMQQLIGIRVERAESDRETKLSAAIVSLQRLYPGVRGRLSALCQPTQRRYHTAVATALGKNLNAIVVDSRRTALECIRYLKEQRIGTATFLPMDTLHVPPTSADAIRQQIGINVKLVRDVIDAEETIQKAVQYACGDTIVAESLDEARIIAFGERRYKVVTVDGELLHKSGNISGGVSSGSDSRSSTWDRSSAAALKSKKDALIEQLSALKTDSQLGQKERDLSNSISQLTSQIRYSEHDRQVARDKLEAIMTSLRDCDSQIEQLQPQIEELKERLSEGRHELDEVVTAIELESKAIFQKFHDQTGGLDVHQFEEHYLAEQRDRANRILEISNRIGRCQSQIDYYRSRFNEQSLNSKRKAIDEKKKQIVNVQNRLSKVQRDIETHEDQIRVISDKIVSQTGSINSAQESLKTLKDELHELRSRSSELQTEISGLESESAKICQRRRDMLQVCALEQINIPRLRNKRKRSGRRSTDDGSDDEAAHDEMDVDRSTGASQSQVDVQEIDTIQADTIDFRQLRMQQEVQGAHEYKAIKEEMEERLARLSAEMEALAPNLKSFDQFDEIKGRVASAGADYEAAKQRSKDASDRFNRVRQERLKKFMDSFQHISGAIDEIYKQLTRSARFPLGGTAYLSLENTEEPFTGGIKYHAMPPTKCFRDMEQLSGGERTVAALALLFAIHSYRPSPFFVLDEIDAALDKTNVTKVARYARFRAHEDNLQCIVISLKDTFFDKADALIGVYKDRSSNSSGSITLDLNRYPD